MSSFASFITKTRLFMRRTLTTLLGAAFAVLASTGCGQKAPQTYEYQEQEIHCTRDGLDIYGIASIPQGGKQKKPLVIMSHGYGGNVRNCQAYADTLARLGYAVYRFDFCGGGRNSKSGGSSRDMSIFTEQKDLDEVIKEAQKWDFVNPDHIFLLGESQGGMVSTLSGVSSLDAIEAAILLYPAYCIADDAIRNFGSLEKVPQEFQFMGLDISPAYYKEIFDFDIFSYMAPLSKDVLIIHGDKDNLVPFSYSERALQVLPKARLETIPGAGHGFRGQDQEMAKSLIATFMLDHTKP